VEKVLLAEIAGPLIADGALEALLHMPVLGFCLRDFPTHFGHNTCKSDV
jgi:hypothetical protein